jgi:CHAD domain-containing protein
MPYRLLQDESVSHGVIRIAREQIEGAIEDIDGSGNDVHVAVHDVRRRCKLVRALVRLVRPVFPLYRQENEWFRNLARGLSHTRDATAAIEALDEMNARFEDLLQPQVLSPFRDRLLERRDEMVIAERLPDRLHDARRQLRFAYFRVNNWRLDETGYAAVGGGLRKTYRRARLRLADAREQASPAILHEWRKRVKYHRYHMKLLSDIWPRVLSARERECHDLTDHLGQDHDLVVLQTTLLGEPERFGHANLFRPLLGLANWRRTELQAAAFPLGLRLFAQSPNRLRAYLGQVYAARKLDPPPIGPLGGISTTPLRTGKVLTLRDTG